MGRLAFAATSLIAAIPAAVLAYLLVMVFLNQGENLKGLSIVVVGLGALVSVVVVLLTPLIMILKGKPQQAVKDVSEEQLSQDEFENAETVGLVSDEIDAAESVDELDVDDVDDFADSAELLTDDSAEIVADSDAFDTFDDDEPPAKPAKKKK